jgi:hypothetical protein
MKTKDVSLRCYNFDSFVKRNKEIKKKFKKICKLQENTARRMQQLLIIPLKRKTIAI